MNKLNTGNRNPVVKHLSTLITILLSLSILTVLSTSFAQSGYYDDWGYWVDTSNYSEYGYDAVGYYDDWGYWVDTSNNGYYDTSTGYYDNWGNFIPYSRFGDVGYVDTGFYDHQLNMQQMQTNFATHNANWQMGQAQNDANHTAFIDYIRQ